MPPAVGYAIAGIASGVGALYGAHKQSSSADKAAVLQSQAANQALEFAKQQDARDRASYEREYQRGIDLENQRRARLLPFVNNGQQASNDITGLLGTAPRIPVGRATGRLMDLG